MMVLNTSIVASTTAEESLLNVSSANKTITDQIADSAYNSGPQCRGMRKTRTPYSPNPPNSRKPPWTGMKYASKVHKQGSGKAQGHKTRRVAFQAWPQLDAKFASRSFCISIQRWVNWAQNQRKGFDLGQTDIEFPSRARGNRGSIFCIPLTSSRSGLLFRRFHAGASHNLPRWPLPLTLSSLPRSLWKGSCRGWC